MKRIFKRKSLFARLLESRLFRPQRKPLLKKKNKRPSTKEILRDAEQ